MARVHKILFVRTDRIGDVLMNLPAIRAMRKSYPKSWITLALDSRVAPLLKGHRDIDELMPVHTGDWKNKPAYRFKILREICAAKFNAAIVSNPDKYFHALTF